MVAVVTTMNNDNAVALKRQEQRGKQDDQHAYGADILYHNTVERFGMESGVLLDFILYIGRFDHISHQNTCHK